MPSVLAKKSRCHCQRRPNKSIYHRSEVRQTYPVFNMLILKIALASSLKPCGKMINVWNLYKRKFIWKRKILFLCRSSSLDAMLQKSMSCFKQALPDNQVKRKAPSSRSEESVSQKSNMQQQMWPTCGLRPLGPSKATWSIDYWERSSSSLQEARPSCYEPHAGRSTDVAVSQNHSLMWVAQREQRLRIANKGVGGVVKIEQSMITRMRRTKFAMHKRYQPTSHATLVKRDSTLQLLTFGLQNTTYGVTLRCQDAAK